MKKNLIVISLISLLLVFMTGCDDILEAFYPEFGEEFNEVIINVEIDNSIDLNDDDPVVITIIPIKDGNLNLDKMWTQEFYWEREITASFSPLPGGNAYKVLIWVDRDNEGDRAGNLIPDPTEPGIQVMHGDGWYMDDIFDFRDPERDDYQAVIEADAHLDSNLRLDFWLIQQFEQYNTGGEPGDFIDFSFIVEGPMTVNKDTPQTDAMYSIRPNNDWPIYKIEWQLLNSNWNQIDYGTNGDSSGTVDLGRREIKLNFQNYTTEMENFEDIILKVDIQYTDPDNMDNHPNGFGEFWIHLTSNESEADQGTQYKLVVELNRLCDYPLNLDCGLGYPARARIMRYKPSTQKYEPTDKKISGQVNGGWGTLEILNIGYVPSPNNDFVQVLLWEPGDDPLVDPPIYISDDFSIFLEKNQDQAFVRLEPFAFHEAGPKTSEYSEGTPETPIALTVESTHTGKVDYDEASFYKVTTTANTPYEITITTATGEVDMEVFVRGFEGIQPDAEWIGGSWNNYPDDESFVAVVGETEIYIGVVGWDDQVTYDITVTQLSAGGGESQGTAAEPQVLYFDSTYSGSIAGYNSSFYFVDVATVSSCDITLNNISGINVTDLDIMVWEDINNIPYYDENSSVDAQPWFDTWSSTEILFNVTPFYNYIVIEIVNDGSAGGTYNILVE